MDPILNELSIDVVKTLSIDERMLTLVRACQALTRLGAARVLRSTRSALDLLLDDGVDYVTIRRWMSTSTRTGLLREERQLLRALLGKGPYVDDLHTSEEEALRQAIEVRHNGLRAAGLGVVFLHGSISVSLTGAAPFMRSDVGVLVEALQEDGSMTAQSTTVPNVWDPGSVTARSGSIQERIRDHIRCGETAWLRRHEIFSFLDWSRESENQLRSMRGAELAFRAVVERLMVLNRAVGDWVDGPFEPPLKFSVDTVATLQDGRVGGERNCTLTSGEVRQLTLHVKLTDFWRIYFEFDPLGVFSSGASGARVLIGYIGKHLRL